MSVTIVQVRSNGQITLPTSVRRQARLEEGDILEALVEPDGTIRLLPKALIERCQTYFWSERWQEGEREAEADIQAGRVRRFEDVDAALEFLDQPEE
jgi:AbrB family looped-hinge helix DNA binding protein